jgi:hypothetical protein
MTQSITSGEFAATRAEYVAEGLEPEPRSEYARQHARQGAMRRAKLVGQRRRPEPLGRSPLPSAREIDAALEAKYGTLRYEEF